VSLATVTAAAEWIDDYAKLMAARVYGDAALPKAERNAATLARYIVKQGFSTLNKRDLKRSPHKSSLRALTEAKDMDAALEVLTDASWLMKAGEREGGSIGRAKADYLVNPAVHGRRA
jgi:putative DNA primase/helicase